MLPKFLRPLANKSLVPFALVIPVLLVGIPALLAFRAEGEVKKSFRWVTRTLEVDRTSRLW